MPSASSAPSHTADQDLSQFDTIIVGFPDLYGRWRGKMISANRFRSNPSAPVQFSDYVFAQDWAQQVIVPDQTLPWWPLGPGGFRDVLLIPDVASLRPIPWRERTALVLGRLQDRDGRDILASPRDLLARVAGVAQERGLTPIAAAELEFYAGVRSPEGSNSASAPLSPSSFAYDVSEFETDDRYFGPILRDLSLMGLEIDCWSVEAGTSQYELNWSHGAIVEAADRAFLFKSAMRQLAHRAGLVVTFMAKPNELDMGSSMHVHQSLWRDSDGANLFFEETSPTGLSTMALSFLAGQLDTMNELTSLFAPTINSYKRYVPGSSAGMNATWGIENPMAGIRAIIDGAGGTRLEFRPPGADANPYLALTAALIGGLSGLDRSLTAPKQTVGDASASKAVEPLPRDLGAAARLLAESDVARSFLGDEFVEYYSAVCSWESNAGLRAVTDWERDRYGQSV